MHSHLWQAQSYSTPYSPVQVVAASFQLLFATGMFLDDCKTWKRKPDADNTWANFKTYFFLAHWKFRETCPTTSGGGFYAANSADSLSSHYRNAAYQQETVDTITNLASTTAYDRESSATLTATVVTLTIDLDATSAKLIKALVKTTKITVTVEKLRLTTPKPHVGGQHYWWSCSCVSAHSSWECPNSKDDHGKYAKSAETKGGSNQSKPSWPMPGANKNKYFQLICNYFSLVTP